MTFYGSGKVRIAEGKYIEFKGSEPFKQGEFTTKDEKLIQKLKDLGVKTTPKVLT